MMNQAVLIGRLTRDVELRYTKSGDAVGNFALAVERPYKNRNGEKDVDFIDITCWRKLAELCAQHIGKGRLVAVAGSIQQDRWEKDGKKRSRHKVVANTVRFLDWPEDKDTENTAADMDADLDGIAEEMNEEDAPF